MTCAGESVSDYWMKFILAYDPELSQEGRTHNSFRNHRNSKHSEWIHACKSQFVILYPTSKGSITRAETDKL